MDEQEIKYEKILVAKHNPENKCFAEEGAILILKPKTLKINKDHVTHHFLDHLDTKMKSKYGWVKAIEPMTLGQFVAKYVGATADPNEIEHVKVMLDSIQKLSVDTPVAVTYSERGVEKKHMDLTIHKVFFRHESVE
jgi:hypothetical protein